MLNEKQLKNFLETGTIDLGKNTMGLDTFKQKVKFVNKSNNEDPKYAHEGDSGFDLRANLENDVVLKPLERKLIPTGLFFDLPPNFEIQVRPRSGMAFKYGLTVLNTPGTVDNQYTGEVKIILVNLSNEDYTIKHGERVAQAVISSVTAKNYFSFEEVEEITKETVRGDGGFGSTGKR